MVSGNKTLYCADCRAVLSSRLKCRVRVQVTSIAFSSSKNLAAAVYHAEQSLKHPCSFRRTSELAKFSKRLLYYISARPILLRLLQHGGVT